MQYMDFSAAEWPGGNSFVQGLKWAGSDFYIYQGDLVVGGENTIIHRYDANHAYKGHLTIPKGGHASATGVMQINPTTSRHIIPAETRGIRVLDYVVGKPTPQNTNFFSSVGYCSGVSCNNDKKRLSIRKGGSKQIVTWYDRDAVLAGNKVVPLLKYQFNTPTGGVNYQGHYNFGNSDFFAWELDLNGNRASKRYRAWVDQYLNGKKVATLDVTRWGSVPGKKFNAEIQGLMAYRGILHVVKRVGPTGPSRIVRAFPTQLAADIAKAHV